jgi:hypothetical protein
MTPDFKEGIIERLWPGDTTEMGVYVILDTARDERVYDAVMSSRTDWACLYSGNIHRELAKVAPYLVKLRKEHFFINSLLRDGWGESWGIFLRSAAGLDELRKHFHGLLTVQDEAGNKIIFRYYDPRVFRVYLPTCNSSELKTVFGPADAFLMEARDSSVLLEFRRQGTTLGIKQHALLHAFSKIIAANEDLTP